MSTRFDRIILVDDNDDDNFIHRRYLKAAGWCEDIRVFTSGPELLAAVQTLGASPDLMFVDLNMPVMSGFELLAELAETTLDLAAIRVVILTSSLHPADRHRAEETPFVLAYVEKPLNLAALSELGSRL